MSYARCRRSAAPIHSPNGGIILDCGCQARRASRRKPCPRHRRERNGEGCAGPGAGELPPPQPEIAATMPMARRDRDEQCHRIVNPDRASRRKPGGGLEDTIPALCKERLRRTEVRRAAEPTLTLLRAASFSQFSFRRWSRQLAPASMSTCPWWEPRSSRFAHPAGRTWTVRRGRRPAVRARPS